MTVKTVVKLSEHRCKEILGYLMVLAHLWTPDDEKLTEQINYIRVQLGEQPLAHITPAIRYDYDEEQRVIHADITV